MTLALSATLMVAVVAAVATRPFGLSPMVMATIGAVVAIASGLISIESLGVIFGMTWDASVTLIALFLLAEALETNRFFDWAAYHVARLAAGSGWRLYLLAIGLTTITTALLANDGAVLMLTPIFAKLLPRIYPNQRAVWLPGLFATGFCADALSGIFIPSNLTNIIVADAFHLGFIDTARAMALPNALALATLTLLFAWRFHAVIGRRYDVATVPNPATALRDRAAFWFGLGLLVALMAGYVVGGELRWPVAAVAAPIALLALGAVRVRNLCPISQLLRLAPWDVLVFAVAMFVVVTAAFTHGAFNGWLVAQRECLTTGDWLAIGSIGLAYAAFSALLNNLPATLIGVLTLGSEPVSGAALYAVLFGVNIGPKLTPFGSLATLLWLGLLRRHGITIGWGEFIRENWWITLATLAIALVALGLV